MPDPLAIANTSPLLYLHQAGCLNILKGLYGYVIVPRAVQGELEEGSRQGFDVPDVTALEWLQVRPVASAVLVPALIDLGPGEAEVIALGLELANSLLILDDQLARRIANLRNLKYTGTLGVLVRAKRAGLISSVSAVVATLRGKGMWLSDAVLEAALRLSGEQLE
ncbi:MAG TPA: DUF3368 domain-containing protein [Dehalococcoidia bacterium]|nr:DUF3368 domain-containing protein [Dehalococcoidia bacterium]